MQRSKLIASFLALSVVQLSAASGMAAHQTSKPLPESGSENPEAARLVQQAATALNAQHLVEALDLLDQAEQLNPKQHGLWLTHGAIMVAAGDDTHAISDFQKELALHPYQTGVYEPLAGALIRTKRTGEAFELWRGIVARDPKNERAALAAGNLLLRAKRYHEIIALLENPIRDLPDSYSLQTMRTQALLRGGNRIEGVAEAERIAKLTSQTATLNDLAYYLADTDSALSFAQTLAERAVSQREKDCADLTLAHFDRKDLAGMGSLGSEWDTLGWVYFKQNNLAKAQSYLNASWLLGRREATALHLARLYEAQGKLDSAAGDELSSRWVMDVAASPSPNGRAEFYVLLSKTGIEDAEFISGSDTLREARAVLKNARSPVPFPADSPAKTIRRGILACSSTTGPGCRFLLLPSSVATARFGMPESYQTWPQTMDDNIHAPVLVTKMEPKYSPAAAKAKVQGAVLLSVLIDSRGLPHDITVVKSLGYGLDEQAKDCVAQWRFTPATKAGLFVSYKAQIEVNFRMVGQAQ